MLGAFGMVYMGILHLRHAYAVVLGKHVCKFTSSVFASETPSLALLFVVKPAYIQCVALGSQLGTENCTP